MDGFELAKHHFLEGIRHYDNGDYGNAESDFLKSLEHLPDRLSTMNNLLATLLKLDKKAEAMEMAERISVIGEDTKDTWLARGLVQKDKGNFHNAAECFGKATELEPAAAEAWYNLASALNGSRKYEEAEAACRKAIELDRSAAEAFINLGIALSGMKRYEAAAAALRGATLLDRGMPAAWLNLGHALAQMKENAAAAECFEKTLELDTKCPFALGSMLYHRLRTCDWRDYDRNMSRLLAELEDGEPSSYPLEALGFTTNSAVHRATAERQWRDEDLDKFELGPFPMRNPNRKITLGYFSPDFHNHPVGFLTAELFELHDRSRFEVIGFSLGSNKEDETRKRIAAAFDRFIVIDEQTDEEIATLAREIEIDIAIDLGGYTLDARTAVFAYRAAPVQVNYLGFPGTMGAKFFDYIVADETLIPQENREYFVEKITYLPHTYMPCDRQREISDKEFARAEFGLPEDGFVFCCFNNAYKIHPPVFDRWMRILDQVDGAVLWLSEENEAGPKNLKREAGDRGIDPDRIVFAQRMPKISDHLSRIRLADLFLDTLPYNAHATANDALWAGLPLVTLMGDSFASRVAASLLRAIELPELVTTTPRNYEALAVELAGNPDRLACIRKKLAENRLVTPLFDSAMFTRHLESAYQAMFDRHSQGLPPDHLHVRMQNH